MAEAMGAKLDWMDDFHGGLIPYAYKEHREEIEKAGTGMRHIAHYEVAILVNQDGQRFVDEGEYPSDKTYGKFGKIVPLTQPGGVAYVVFDSQTRDIVDPVYTGPAAKRLFYDTVGHGSQPALHSACQAFGAGQLVPGSDYPVLLDFESYADTFAYIRRSGLPQQDIQQILYENAPRPGLT